MQDDVPGSRAFESGSGEGEHKPAENGAPGRESPQSSPRSLGVTGASASYLLREDDGCHPRNLSDPTWLETATPRERRIAHARASLLAEEEGGDGNAHNAMDDYPTPSPGEDLDEWLSSLPRNQQDRVGWRVEHEQRMRLVARLATGNPFPSTAEPATNSGMRGVRAVYLTAAEAARMLGLTVAALRGRVRRGSKGFKHLSDPVNRDDAGRFLASAVDECPRSPDADPDYLDHIARERARVQAAKDKMRALDRPRGR